MQDKIFYAVCFGFLCGVLLRSFVSIDLYVAVLLSIISTAIFLFFLISKNNWGIIASIFILTFSLGIWRFGIADVPNPEIFESKLNQKAVFSGEIADEPSIREKNQQLIVKTESIKILLSVGLEGDYEYGDEIEFTGTLKRPENFITDTGKVFDYINYLRKDGILYVMSYPEIEVISQGHGNFIKSALFAFREKFLQNLNFAIKSPENLLMGGLILGERAAFSQELRQDFIDTGTIHIVALSGYNVSIVADWFMKIFSFLPRNFGFGAGIFSVLLFVLMTGANSTAVRAGIMAILALFARATGRNYEAGRGLILAAMAMVLWNPFLLAYDVSFELSVLATVAVIFLAPKIEKYFLWVTQNFGLREIVSVTVAAYVFVLPFILYQMGNFSLVALPANILVLPAIPPTMFFGFLTGLAGLLWSGFALPFSVIAELLLSYELGVIRLFANFPFASFSFPYFSLILTLLIYIAFIYYLFGEDIKNFSQRVNHD